MIVGMSVKELVPWNTQTAGAVGVGGFKRFLESRLVDLDYITACFSVYSSGKRIATFMDQFSMHRALNENAKGTKLKPTAVMSYFRQERYRLPRRSFAAFPKNEATSSMKSVKKTT
ncbi:hypothetical protein PybrP1_000350 [[Pythium] brassicae (nom. inval.)]|nr:hypothetical protein PybrP1_000350 [[Pythium] brassicae (nom. inval.)]